MKKTTSRIAEGQPFPLGATWNGHGVNFSLFSAHATKVELCLFDSSGRREIERIVLPEYTDEVWHVFVYDLRPGTIYGYRVHGPYEPEAGHRFNPHKLLLDPYAKAHVGALRWHPAVFGYTLKHEALDLSFDARDSAPYVPRCRVVDQTFSWHHPLRERVARERMIVYETHVRGYTIRHPEVPPEQRGTFAGLAHPAVLDGIRHLGVTSVELMPVHMFLNDSHLLERGLTNYWGYNTIGFFAPDPRYSVGAQGSIDEFKLMVDRFHESGLEVLLDVVYNHTAEGSELGPTLSFRGIDNASYYRLLPDTPRYHINDTGTGNTLNLSHPRVLQMVTDSLRYWANSYRIDGFRFDLGVTLGREAHGFDPGSGFFDALRQDPVLSQCKLISEPWDVGPGGYQLGNHPPGFSEWNDRFRDSVRRFWRGDPHQRPELAARLTGSADLFDKRKRRPWASINFVTSHDGFTLADVVAYDRKHNEANGEDNHDGHNENWSANWGAEGATDDPAIVDTRARVARSMLATLFVALGTPMLLAGDEACRTQRGNNNAYCQDNEISWVDWTLAASPEGEAMTAFAARAIALRRDHPLLRETRFLFGEREVLPEVHDIDWFDERGEALSPEAWQDPEGRALVMRRAGPGLDGEIEVLLIMLNAAPAAIAFSAPAPSMQWDVLLDSAHPEAAPHRLPGATFEVAAHTIAVLCAWPTRKNAHEAAVHEPALRDDAPPPPDPRMNPGTSPGTAAPSGAAG